MTEIDHLAFIVTSGAQASDLEQEMRQAGFYFTHIDSMGGILQEQTVCLLAGTSGPRLPELLDLAQQACKPYRQFIPTHLNVQTHLAPLPMVEAEMGGAVIYIVEVERFEQI